jgi:hypothetical protein
MRRRAYRCWPLAVLAFQARAHEFFGSSEVLTPTRCSFTDPLRWQLVSGYARLIPSRCHCMGSIGAEVGRWPNAYRLQAGVI